jgi:hypothetical protein
LKVTDNEPCSSPSTGNRPSGGKATVVNGVDDVFFLKRSFGKQNQKKEKNGGSYEIGPAGHSGSERR